MSKLIINKPQYDNSKTRHENYAKWINDYWRCQVAYPNNQGGISSTLQRGVPVEARDAGYKHRDIVWVKIDADGKWRVTRE